MLESGELSFLGIELRGASIVAAMAELEHMLAECLTTLVREVNSSSTQVSMLRTPLRALAAHSLLESLAAAPGSDTAWTHRLALTDLNKSSQIASLPLAGTKRPQPLLDGKQFGRTT